MPASDERTDDRHYSCTTCRRIILWNQKSNMAHSLPIAIGIRTVGEAFLHDTLLQHSPCHSAEMRFPMYIHQRRLPSILQAIEMTTDTVHHAHSNSAKPKEEKQTFQLLQESSSTPKGPFMLKQGNLVLDSAAIADKRAVRANDAVTWNDKANRVPPHRAANRLG